MLALLLSFATALAAPVSLRLKPPANWREEASPAAALTRVFVREDRAGNVRVTYTDSGAPGSRTKKDFETYVHSQYAPSKSGKLTHRIELSHEFRCGTATCFSAIVQYRNGNIRRYAAYLSFEQDGKPYLGLFAIPVKDGADATARRVLTEMERAL